MNRGFNKKGQQNVAVIILSVLCVVFFVTLVALAGFNSWNWAFAMEKITSFLIDVLSPIFRGLLGLTGESNDFLMILTFILLGIIITGILDTVNVFTNPSGGSNWLNFFVGIIVSIIGVRFMPPNLWASLAAPSSAFVATILVGIPFGAFFFLSLKVKSTAARKVLWLFYVIFMSYLIFFPQGVTDSKFGTGMLSGQNDFAYTYLVFLVLAITMLFFDSSVRGFFYREKSAVELADIAHNIGLKERQKIREDIDNYYKIIADPNAPPQDKADATKKLKQLKKAYGDLSVF